MKNLICWILTSLLVATATGEPSGPKAKAEGTQRVTLAREFSVPGCAIRLDLPAGWTPVEGKGKAGESKIYRSDKGKGPVICTILAVKSYDGGPDELPDEQVAGMLSPENIRENFAAPSSRIVRVEARAIAGKPGGMFVSDIPADPPTGNPPRRSMGFVTLDHRYLVMISFQFHGEAIGAATLDEAEKAYAPVFETILKSIVREPQAGNAQPEGPPDEVARRNETSELTTALESGIDQTVRIERIRRDFPDLRAQADEAAGAWDSSVFAKGAQGVEGRLKALQGEMAFERKKGELLAIRRKKEAAKPLSPAQAADFLKQLGEKAAHGPEGDVRAILLAMNPDFRAHPEAEMASGWNRHVAFKEFFPMGDYQTGIDLPASWAMAPRLKGETRVAFVSGNGFGPVTCVIMARKALEGPLGDPEAAGLFTPEEMKKRLAGEKLEILESGSNEVTGHPGGWLHTREEGSGPDLPRHTTTYLTMEGPYLIRIDLSIQDKRIAPLSVAEADRLWTPAFEAILQSFVRDPSQMPASTKQSLERSEARGLLDLLKMLKLQSFVLDRYDSDFPEFRARAGEVKAKFAASPYGKSEDVIMKDLVRLQGADFKPDLEGKLGQWQDEIRKAPHSEADPGKFLDQVEGHADGDFPESVRQSLAATNREFREHPEREIAAGCTRRITLAREFKAPGSKAALAFPISWRTSRKDKAGAASPILGFRSNDGYGPVECIFRINKVSNSEPPTDAQTAAYLAPERLRENQHDPTMKITDAAVHPIAGMNGVRVLADAYNPRDDKAPPTRTATYMTFAGYYMINVSFSLRSPTGEAVADKMEDWLPLFDAILDTLVRE